MHRLPVLALAVITSALPAAAANVAAEPAAERFTPAMRQFAENFKPDGNAVAATTPPLAPAEAIAKMKLADGFAIETVVHEPVVRQPLDMRFDERGRLWVVQYIQYPFPAGLKIVSYDRYLRAEYDRMPPPPPQPFSGEGQDHDPGGCGRRR